MADPDDEALRWGDESDPTHADARPSETVSPLPSDGVDARPTSPALLIAYGIFGGIYLLYIVGWVVAVLRDTYASPLLLPEIMYQFGEFLAIASPAVWMLATFAFTSSARPLMRLGWLVAGLVVVAPWPFVLGGGSGA